MQTAYALILASLPPRHDEEAEEVEEAPDDGRARQDDALRDERELRPPATLAAFPLRWGVAFLPEAAEALAEVRHVGGVASVRGHTDITSAHFLIPFHNHNRHHSPCYVRADTTQIRRLHDFHLTQPADFAAAVADHVDAVEGAPVPEGRQVHGEGQECEAFPLCLSLRQIRVTLPEGGIAGRQRPSTAEESAGGHRLRDSLFLPLRALGKRRAAGNALGLICRLKYWPRQFECPSVSFISGVG